MQGWMGANTNQFALLYQKAAWEATERARGEGQGIIWTRSAWAGDAAGTYDELAGTPCGGLPMFRSLVFDWPGDPAVWSLADEYFFGEAFLVCSVLDASGVRSVYLPEGAWVDFWSGQTLMGPLHLHAIHSSLACLPLYVRYGSQIPFAEPVQNKRPLPGASRVTIRFDKTYPGFEDSLLKKWIEL